MTTKEIHDKYPQFDFIGDVYTLAGKRYIRAEYRDSRLSDLVGRYYYCIEDDNFLLTDDFGDMVCDL